jgi:16S rRNA processing protein RimM
VVELGRIVGRHGIRGDVRLLPHNPDSELFATLTHVLLARDGRIERRQLLSVRPHKRLLLARFEGVDTANAADAIVGSSVCVHRDQLPALAPNQVYHIELIGCPVRTENGVVVGRVREVFSTASNDVCVVSYDGREFLIPLIADVVVRLSVTPPEPELVIRPIPGLLDEP